MLTWGLRFNHWWGAADSERIAARIAEIINRPCFAEAVWIRCFRKVEDELCPEEEKSRETVFASLRDPRTDMVVMRQASYLPETASVRIETGFVRWQRVPLTLRIAVPLPDDPAALEDAACALACAQLISAGCISVWPKHEWAMKFSDQVLPETALAMGISDRRRREWHLQVANVDIDTEIAGPEWALFLSAGHLSKLPLSTLRASGAFAEVRELPGNRAYLRLTDDPRDALAPDYETHLDRAREALRPILADLSRVDWLYRR